MMFQRGRHATLLQVAFTLIFALLLAGCTDRGELESNWQDYISRLSRVLDRDAGTAGFDSSLHFPRPRDLALTFETSNIDLLDFLRLRRCALRETIAQRNSILGRHGDASAKLIFDLRFLNEAEDCIQILNSDGKNSLATQLREAVNLKRRELPSRIFLASIAGAEFREFWQAPPDLRAYPNDGKDPSIAALARWQYWQQQWLSGNWQHNADDVLLTLGEIRLGGGGALLRAQQLNTHELARASEIIKQRLNGRPLCLKPSPTAAAEQFRNVLSSRFISRIQTQASLINQHQYALLEQILAIENTLFSAMTTEKIAVPAAYLTWVKQRDELLEKATQAQRQHVKVAAELLAQCGLSPGGSGQH
ncbi:Uncharacterised protein [Zhongshania aliphaticivorans]|nr:Uncharacterised protein [Zhongshania aliphaticivorans]